MPIELVQRLVVTLVVVLLVASGVGYLLVPSAMLRIVGIDGDPQANFLVRTIAAALLALAPGAWAARRRAGSALRLDRARGLHVRQFADRPVCVRQ